jgi:hypothetical protein
MQRLWIKITNLRCSVLHCTCFHGLSVITSERSVGTYAQPNTSVECSVFSWTLHPHHDTFCENVHRLRKLRSYKLDSTGSWPKPQIVQLKIRTNIYPTWEQPDPYGSSANNNGTFRENTLKKLKGYRTITMELLSIMPEYSARTPTNLKHLEPIDLHSWMIRHAWWIIYKHNPRHSHLEPKSQNSRIVRDIV